MTKEQIELIKEIANNVDDIKPILSTAVVALLELSGELKPAVDSLIDYTVDRKAESVNRLMKLHGFTKDEAIMLTLDIQSNLLRSVKKDKK